MKPKKHLPKGFLYDLLERIDQLEKYVRSHDYNYPKDTTLFSSSIPEGLIDPEDIEEHFRSEIGKMIAMGHKIDGWIDYYKRHYLSKRKRGPDLEEGEGDEEFLPNLSTSQLLAVFQPINPDTNKVFVERTLYNWVKDNSIAPIASLGRSKLYSVSDFKRHLRNRNVRFDEETSNFLLEYMKDEGRFLSATESVKRMNNRRKKFQMERTARAIKKLNE